MASRRCWQRARTSNGRDLKSWTPLMYAATNGYMLMVQPLLEAGADPNVIDLTGATALHMASGEGIRGGRGHAAEGRGRPRHPGVPRPERG